MLIRLEDKQSLHTHLGTAQFIDSSYKLYGNLSGFQNYGIIGFKLKQNIINAWRHILVKDNVYEVETPIVTPYSVLKNSGHVDRFVDYVVIDKNGVEFRADHIVENYLNNNIMLKDSVDLSNKLSLQQFISDHKLIDNNNIIVTEKNLMIKSDDDFLRPEIAQGIFVTMDQYLEYFGNKLPFGIAQTGKSYRKEISTQPFIRLKEFTQAEIEYIFDPKNPFHNEYDKIKHNILPLLPATLIDSTNNQNQSKHQQTEITMITIEEAVNCGIINNQILGFWLFKIYEFCKYIGLNTFRFRQHLPNEMSHYAVQCWDLECLCFDSWLECIGLAHRGSYDLTAHNIKNIFLIKDNSTFTTKSISKINLKAVFLKYGPSIGKEIAKYELAHSGQNNDYVEYLVNKYNLDNDCITVDKINIFDTFIPHIIEPSFGIDRLCYAVITQNCYKRTIDLNRVVIQLNRNIAPYEVSVFYLVGTLAMKTIVNDIVSNLSNNNIKVYTDLTNANIGKKYVRADEIGIPHAITVDHETILNNTVTLRDITTMEQQRYHINDIIAIIKN
jgi:glycyl-tRNA synthetase